jgi:hypothetical protein
MKNMNIYGELHRFIPRLRVGMGKKKIETTLKTQNFKYGISRTLMVVLDLVQ